MRASIGTCLTVGVVTGWCAASAQSIRLEAETGTRNGTTIQTATGGYSGTGYVSFFGDLAQSVQVQANVPDGLYELWIGYNSPFGYKGYDYAVDSQVGSGGFDGNGNQWDVDRVGAFELTGTTNTLQISRGWGWYNVDYFELRPYTPPTLLPISTHLINPQADRPTQLLMNYLVSQYGQKTLSGLQHNVSENLAFPVASYLSQSGGVVPAIRGSDLIDYSPSRLAFGENPRNETEQTIAWAQQTGGVVSVMWHWNAPTSLINQPGKEWWRGFYADSTTFDLPGALAHPTGSDFQLLLRDIDAAAVELKKYQAAGIPVIWRPLHEAQGGWFWWGAHGPETFQQLWNLMYDRLTNYHGLNNLIWEFTSIGVNGEEPAWYPGDDRVDLVGLDIYTRPADSMNGAWTDAAEMYNGRKMVALSETDTIFDPATLDLWGTHWSYAAPWTWDFVRSEYTKEGYSLAQLTAALQTFLHSEDVITLGELPAFPWRRGTSVPGDFNVDGIVDASDFTVWRDAYGQRGPELAADANGDGVIDLGDYAIWQLYFNVAAAPPHAHTTVPEPHGAMAALGSLGILVRRRRSCRK